MKEMICIICPRGCHLTVSENGEIHGNFLSPVELLMENKN